MKLVKILKYLNKKFPEKTMSKWDKSGLQVYDRRLIINPEKEIKNVFITIDLTQAALNQALNNNADLIITRHPFIFNGLELEKNNPQKLAIIKQLLKANTPIYSIHTNYDVSAHNELISLIQNQMEVKKIHRFGENKEGMFIKLKQPLNSKQFQSDWKTLFPRQEFSQSKNWTTQTPIKEFYLVSGAGGDSMIESALTNTTFVSGELKWHHWLYALDNNVRVLALGHEMENHFSNHLDSLLKNAYPDLMITTYHHSSPFIIQKLEV